MDADSTYSSVTYIQRFGSLGDALEAAGPGLSQKRLKSSDEVLCKEVTRLADELA